MQITWVISNLGPPAGLVSRADRTIDPQVIAEQWDRMGQFYASLESGHTTASVALKRLASCTAENRFYRANRDLGRIFKTEFLLSYLSEAPLRSRIRRGLLKVEHRPHRTPARIMCQLLRVMRMWFPDRRLIFVGDAGYGTHEVARFAHRHRRGLTLVSKLRPDANLFEPPPPYHGKGRPRVKGSALPK